MTVSRLDNSVKSNCNGSTVEFPFEFPILESSDLTVTLINSSTGAETVLVEGTNYRVDPSDSGYTAGGTVTTQAAGESGMEDYAYPSGYQILIERSVPSTQTMDLRTGQNIDLQDLEDAMDKLQMQVIDMKNQIDRCIQIPTQDGSLTTLLDPAVVRADKFLHFDEEGNAHASSGPIVGITPTTYAESLLDAEDAEEARAVLGIVDASETVKGIAELATQAETDAGTDNSRSVTPLKLAKFAEMRGMKNFLINGCMRVAQRGADQTLDGNPRYGRCDRWFGFWNGTGIQSQQNSKLYLTSLTNASTGNLYIGQRIEGKNAQTLLQASIHGGVSIQFKLWHNFGSSADITVAINTADTLDTFTSNTNRYKSSAIPVASGEWTQIKLDGVNIGTTDIENGVMLYIIVTTPVCSGKTVYLADAQIEIGPACTTIEKRPYGLELALCQRYYQFGSVRAKMYAAASQVFGYQSSLPVVMRAAPTIAFSNATYEGAAGVDFSSPWLNSSFFVYAVKDGSAGMGSFQADYTASAEL